VQTTYSYEPFGTTTTSGAGTTSAFGFTGREADGTGLHYYRARYYDARLQRFIGEDPLGFAAGDVNLHAYVANSPVNAIDPTGEFGLGGCAIGAGMALVPHLPDLMAGRGKIPLRDMTIGCVLGGVGIPPLLRRLPRFMRPSGARPGTYRPPNPLPRGPNGEFAPSSPYPHTQLGSRIGQRGQYTVAREFGPNGRPIRDIHFTNHGRPNVPGHVNPHQHQWLPNPSGGTPVRGPAQPYRW
jgi:RHS repeat-associated protein